MSAVLPSSENSKRETEAISSQGYVLRISFSIIAFFLCLVLLGSTGTALMSVALSAQKKHLETYNIGLNWTSGKDMSAVPQKLRLCFVCLYGHCVCMRLHASGSLPRSSYSAPIPQRQTLHVHAFC